LKLGTPSAAVLTILEAEPTIEFSSPTYTVKESAMSALITVKRAGPLAGTVLVGYTTSDGNATSALPNPDYRTAAGTLTFGPGASSRSFVVPIVKDALVEGPETVTLTLTPITGGVSLGAANPATLTILDAPSILQFSAPHYTTAEPVSQMPRNATLTVTRSGSLFGTVLVDYAVTGGTATPGPGGDYVLNPATLTFGPGVSSRTFPLAIQPDAVVEGSETVNLTLTNPVGAVIGSPGSVDLTILDSEPTVQFAAAKYTASEVATKTMIVVKRTGTLSAPATVDYAVTGGSATNGADYSLPASGTLTFPAGAATASLPVTLIPDTVDEPNETVELTLSNPLLDGGAGLGLGTPAVTTVTIADNDTAGSVQFSAADYGVAEHGGSVTLTVTRTGGTSSQATVDYVVTGGTATAGSDYTLLPGTLTFGLGETTRALTIPIVDDTLVEGTETILLALTNPGGGLALGPRAAATVWILDDD
jgi:hypothetical protein